MKLRIKDSSLRFRLLRSEVKALAETGRIEAHTCFSVHEGSGSFCYAIAHSAEVSCISATHVAGEMRVTAPSAEILHWAKSDVVGLYGEQPVFGGKALTIAIEKDFACIDGSDSDNTDTFDNPTPANC